MVFFSSELGRQKPPDFVDPLGSIWAPLVTFVRAKRRVAGWVGLLGGCWDDETDRLLIASYCGSFLLKFPTFISTSKMMLMGI